MRIMLTGGGTGGHVFPLLAVAGELKAKDGQCEFHWFGSQRMESQLVPEVGIRGTFLRYTFSYRRLGIKSLGYYLRTIPTWILGIPLWAAVLAIKRFQPDLVLSSGGYVSVPMLLAARLMKIPIGLIELNSVPGRVAKAYARHAWRVYCATDIAAQKLSVANRGKVVITGYFALKPKLMADEARARFGIPSGIPLLIVQGGSAGAAPVNRLIESMLNDEGLLARLGNQLAILHQRGSESAASPCAGHSRWPYYRSIAFDRELFSLYFAAQLYVGRAGAATISELIEAKLPAILIPYPLHADRQQFLNAGVLANAGAAEILEEEAPNAAGKLVSLVESCLDELKSSSMRAAFENLPRGGDSAIAADILKFIPIAGGR